jgi:hypothetical protein
MTIYYDIIRNFFNTTDKIIVKQGLTLEEAQKYCQDPETSSSTATSDEAKHRTEIHGPWFDGHREQCRNPSKSLLVYYANMLVGVRNTKKEIK